jgi:hypothetical protein
MERTDAGIAAPRENQLCSHAHADHLIIDEIGRHSNERQTLFPLPDNLVAGCERNEMREPFAGKVIAIVNQFGNRF